LYCRLSAAELRRQLVALKGYQSETLPSEETIRQRINPLGYWLKRVAKNQIPCGKQQVLILGG